MRDSGQTGPIQLEIECSAHLAGKIRQVEGRMQGKDQSAEVMTQESKTKCMCSVSTLS
jgi:hypothetical protein